MTVPRTLLYIMAAGVLLRLLLLAFAVHEIGTAGLVAGDAVGYVELGHNLAAGNGFSALSDGVLTKEVFRTPGLPLLIAPFTLLPLGIVIYGIFFSILGGMLLPFFTYRIGTRLAGGSAALIASAIVAVEPHAAVYSFLPQTEVPFILFALGGFLAVLISYERKSLATALFSGALLGYAVFVRPGFLDIVIPLAIGTGLVLFFSKDARYKIAVALCLAVFAVLTPWYVRNYEVTGAFALSGEGWRNVYTDYLASVRSLQHNTSFADEKNALKDEALPRFGMTRADVNSPASARILRDAALAELWQDKATVVKLETTLLVSFFFNDGYYYDFRHLGYLHDTSDAPHISPVYELLTKHLTALPSILQELARQRFIPLWGRLFTLGTLLLGIIGFFLTQSRLRYLLLGAILLSALISTAIGLGLDARMRVPVEPLIFIFAGTALVWFSRRVTFWYAH